MLCLPCCAPQASWHPDSDCHLALLTSDATWRLYNTQRTDLPEQTFELQLRGRWVGGWAALTCAEHMGEEALGTKSPWGTN